MGCVKHAKHLVEVQKEHKKLVVMLATAAPQSDEEKLKGFLKAVGTDMPLVYGLSDDELENYMTKGWSQVRFVRGGKLATYKDDDGEVMAIDIDEVEDLLEE